jgi:hypothetical protein
MSHGFCNSSSEIQEVLRKSIHEDTRRHTKICFEESGGSCSTQVNTDFLVVGARYTVPLQRATQQVAG